MTQTVVNGGDRASQDFYAGLPKEVTADLSNMELRLHDGSTPGGKRIPNLDTNDARYQAKNAEIDGFQFDANAKGLLVRLSAGIYRLRKFISGDDSLKLTNPDGSAGNIDLRLADSIPGDREFLGDAIFRKVVQVDGGINADTSGTHTGSLVGNSAGTHTGPQIGDVDVRGKSLQLDDGQIPQRAIAGLSQYSLPVGAVMLWSGTVANIPAQWHLCDGTNGTPDLRGLFVVGASSDSDQLATIGSETHSHVVTAEAAGSHTHDITVQDTVLTLGQIPGHAHGNGVNDQNSVVFPYGTKASLRTDQDLETTSHGGVNTQGVTETVGGGLGHAHGASSAAAGTHTHIISMQPGSNIPPSVLLAYIMKIS